MDKGAPETAHAELSAKKEATQKWPPFPLPDAAPTENPANQEADPSALYPTRTMGSVTPASTLITQRRYRKSCDTGERKDFAEPKKAVLKTPRPMKTKTLSIQPRTPRQTSLTALPN
ncbi:hypothetical protein AtDm6_0519 [Acetobacter tropicalis]|uniref:Uncharacterized protein n=1 Tax=Acetobacter tropicalis TaxID=104102 RepID=A0A094YXC9_9PROT|nr:hypothetical protein AtDm6_0519 [Acetobacter tropicalis]